jgi:16S rRNA G966 N2-methylase RsmD
MFELLLRPEVQRYIRAHASVDEKNWLLKHTEVEGVPARVIAQQLAGLRKAKEKLPSWATSENIIYPPATNLEQTSSEATARFKEKLVSEITVQHRTGIDLTCGWGVDSFFLSNPFESWTCLERDPGLLAMAQHNHQQLGRQHVVYQHSSAEDWLTHQRLEYDWVYIDPSRRRSGNEKVVSLSACEPDIVSLQATLLQMAPNVLIKTSPLLDITQALRELTFVRQVYVVAVGNECKELLFYLQRDFSGEPAMEACHLSDRDPEEISRFSFFVSEEKRTPVVTAEANRFLYEPNAAMMKAGAFKLIGQRYGLQKLHSNSHLYTSAEQMTSFPGRTFEIVESVKPDKTLVSKLPEGKANILLRNYPLTVEEFKKKTGIREGGETYVIGTRSIKNLSVWLCRKV